MDVRELLRREIDPSEIVAVRELWKQHSIAEENRDLPGLVATLTDDCVYQIVGTPHRWEGHDGASRFYGGLLSAFPDIDFQLTDIVVGPQGVCEEAHVSGTHERAWLEYEASGGPVEFDVVIFFPWDRERRLFRGEKVYVHGVPARTDGGDRMEGYEHRTEDEVLAEQEADAVEDLEHVTPDEQRRLDDTDAGD
ncbi:MAG: nuclear transport factor 2 family protein [Actinomycetota bacterium]|nr:nuclear transport factor 2 family protein [Actinomycetota bacterium]